MATTDQLELEQLAESELDRLQKQLRKLEKDRVQFIGDKRIALMKKERILNALKQERGQLEERILLEHEGSHARKEMQAEKKLIKLMEKKETIEKSIGELKTRMNELNEHIKKLEKENRKLDESQSTEKQYNEQIHRLHNDIRKLENQLDVVNKRCGNLMFDNANLRSSIDHLLMERTKFNEMWQKMVTQYDQGKKFIMDLIEQSVSAYDQREELGNKIQNLNDKQCVETNNHTQEIRELQRKLDHDAKLQDFFAIKGNRRVNAELESRENERRLKQQELADEHLKNLQTIMNQIQCLSGENIIDKLSLHYKKQEEENFALFNYVNELSYEVEMLNDTVHRIQDDIDKQKTENELKKQTQRDSTIEALEKQLKYYSAKVNDADAVRVDCEKDLREMLNGIENLFRLLKCDQAAVLNMIGSGNGITIDNVKLFLGIIKQRIIEIINCLNYADQSGRILGKRDRIPKFNVKDLSVRYQPNQ